MKSHPARRFKFQNDQTARLSPLVFCLLVAGFVNAPLQKANAQTPGVLYTWSSAGVQDWFKNFGAGSTSATLGNPGPGALIITETSTAVGGSQAFTDGFNTIREGAPFSSGCCGGIDLTGLSSLEFDMGHNGVGNVNVQFFVQASPGSTFLNLGPDLAVAPGMNTYSVPLTGLTADQIAYIRTMGINIRDHAGEGNLTWTIQEVRSAGTPITSRVIADHDGGAADFDGVICNFDCGAVSGGNGGQNNSGMSIVGNALEWVDLGGGPGVAITYGNGTQNTGGGFNARPVDLSNYDIITFRMRATGAETTLGVQFYMQTGSGFNYQSANSSLPVDGSYHDLVFPLAGITARNFVDTTGVNLFGHTNNLIVDIDSVIVSVLPPTPCIQVVKQCAYPSNSPGSNSPTCFAAGAIIDFTGFVTNCGNTRLTNVTVIDSRPLLGAGLLDTNGFPLIQPLTLDQGQVIGFRGSFAPTLAETCAGAAANSLTARGTDVTPRDAGNISVTNVASTDCAICGVSPCIFVTKVCSTNLVALCGTNSSSMIFSGIVSNCGNFTLTNVVLSDDLTAGVVLRLGSLVPGATAPWSTNLPVTAALCGRSNIVNTVTAVGANLCNPAQFVTNRANCSFTVVCPNPSISVTKACASPIVTNVGSSLTVTGQVCNTGPIAFDNVVVIDAQPGSPAAATNNIGTLAPGQCKPYSFTYTATSCDPNHDTVTATGTSACGTATASASADCFLCCPGITIQSFLSCLLPGAVCSGNSSAYGPTATGVKGNLGDPTADNPAFCYIIIVRNTGHDPLTNIVIHDDRLGSIGTFPGPLAVGGTITISNLRTNWAATTTNTSMVTAQCGGVHANGASVGASTNAVAVVLSGASVTCAMSISSPDDLDGNPNDAHVAISGSGNHNVTFTTIITAGSMGLANVTIISPTLTGFGCPLPPPFSLAANSNFTYVCTASINCTNLPGGALTNVAVVTAQIGASPGVCAYNLAGTPVLVTSTNSGPPCAVVLECNSNHPPVAKCKNIVVSADANCQGDGSVDDGSFDPDGDAITIVQSPAGPYPLGTNGVTLCVTDSQGATNCCNATVTVVDTTPPDLNCPTNTIVVTNDPGQCSAVVNYTVTATDNCGGCALLSEDFTAGDGGFTVNTPQPFNTPWAYNAGAGSWQVVQDAAEVQHPMTTMLQSSAINVTCAGHVRLTFAHRYSFEYDGTRWDGGQVQISVNGGAYVAVPLAAFNQNGYNGTVAANSASALQGQPAFTADSQDFAGSFIISIADLGAFNAGDTISVQFLYAGDTNTRGQFIPSWEVTSVALAVGNGSGSVTLVCEPASGSTFPVGTNAVCCVATDAAGNTNVCCFDVTVLDREAPKVECKEGVNPSGKKIPVAGKNPASGQNPDGYYQLLAKDNCDPNPLIFIADTGSTFVAGPFASGDVIKLTQSPGRAPSQDPAPAPIVAHVHLKGDGLLYAVDADGNISEGQLCLVPRPPK